MRLRPCLPNERPSNLILYMDVAQLNVKEVFEILQVVVLTRCRTLCAILGASTRRVLVSRGPLPCRIALRPLLPAVVVVVVQTL